MTPRLIVAIGVSLATALLAGCTLKRVHATACDLADPALTESAFVILTQPSAGARVKSGFVAQGCAQAGENIRWRLSLPGGKPLAEGELTTAGDGPVAFTFAVPFVVEDRQIAYLDVRRSGETLAALVSVPVILAP